MTKKEELQIQISILENEREGIHRTRAPLDERLLAIHEELGRLRIEEMKDDPDWKSIVQDLAGNGKGSMALLRFAEQKLLEDFDMYHSGYYTETLEICIKLKVERNPTSKAKNAAGLKYFAPLLRPHNDGQVKFGIFETGVGARGIYELLVKPDLSQLVLTVTVYGQARVLEKFTSPESAVAYLAEHHWYGED